MSSLLFYAAVGGDKNDENGTSTNYPFTDEALTALFKDPVRTAL